MPEGLNLISMDIELPIKFHLQYDTHDERGHAGWCCRENGTINLNFHTKKEEIMEKIYAIIRKARQYKEINQSGREVLFERREALEEQLTMELEKMKDKKTKKKKVKKKSRR